MYINNQYFLCTLSISCTVHVVALQRAYRPVRNYITHTDCTWVTTILVITVIHSLMSLLSKSDLSLSWSLSWLYFVKCSVQLKLILPSSCASWSKNSFGASRYFVCSEDYRYLFFWLNCPFMTIVSTQISWTFFYFIMLHGPKNHQFKPKWGKI